MSATVAQEVMHLDVAGGLAAAATRDGCVYVWDPNQVQPLREPALCKS